MLISECFLSLQWEGRNTGKSSIFLRFRGCNLKCWYCDTPYAVIDDTDSQDMDIDDIVDKIKALPCKHIVFTWGEPALFEKYIQRIQSKLDADRYYTYEIETNWSIELKNFYHQVNVSYKTSNSWNKSYELKAVSTKFDYKFVVANEKDIQEVEKIVKEYKLPEDRIYLMPLWTTKDSQVNIEVANYCIKSWYRYCQRVHIMLFGDRKGV